MHKIASHINRLSTVLFGLLLSCSLAACAAPQPSSQNAETASKPQEEKTLTVYGAASLTESLTQAGKDYEALHPGVHVVFTFDSSGTLKTQLAQGAEADLFISAGQKQMNQLDTEHHLVDTATRKNLLENKVVLAVASDHPTKNAEGLSSFEMLSRRLPEGDFLLGMGNADVPVGQYTQKILSYYKLDEAALANAGHISYGSNVKEVTTQVTEGTVDAGIIYETDAHSAGLTVIDRATPEMCGQVLYSAAVLTNAHEKELAQDFLSYLSGDGRAAFEAVGFTVLND